MWSEFTLINYKNLKKIKKKYIDTDSLFYKKISTHLSNLKNYKNITFDITETKISKNRLNKLIDTEWVYKGVTKDIKNLSKEYLISWDNNKIYLKCTEIKFLKIKSRLPYLIKMISYIKNTNEELNIYLLLSSLKKKIDNYKNISPKNINSGYTDNINRYIFIWREEEFEKVLFHELIHFFNHDHSNEIYTHYIKFDSLFEAITDFKAIIYNLIYLSFLTNKKLCKLINYEFSFINNQGIMIIMIMVQLLMDRIHQKQ